MERGEHFAHILDPCHGEMVQLRPGQREGVQDRFELVVQACVSLAKGVERPAKDLDRVVEAVQVGEGPRVL